MFLTGAWLLWSATATAQDWPQWRGPKRDGTAAFQPPAEWPREPRKLWQVEIGEGHSTPAVVGQRVYAHSRQGDNEVVRCLNLADGSEIWSKSYMVPYEPDPAAQPHGLGPKASPAVAEGRLFTSSITGVLTAWDIKQGKQLWRQDFAGQFTPAYPQFGASASPLVDGKLLIVDVGGKEGGMLAALDVATGKPKWPLMHADGPAYASPIVAKLAGAPQYVTQSRTAVMGVSTAGKLLWSAPFETQYEQNSVSPVQVGELLICGGYQRSTLALLVSRNGQTWNAKTAWENDDLPLYMNTPVAAGELLFGMTQRDSGRLFCLDARRNKLLWSGTPRFGENASLLLSGKLLLALSNEAELVVAAASGQEFSELARYRLAESPTWAHPVPVGDKLLVKDLNALALWSFSK